MKKPIEDKRAKIKDLSAIIGLQPPVLLTTKELVDHQQFRLELALKTLRDEFRDREADLKIAAMERVIQIIKQENDV